MNVNNYMVMFIAMSRSSYFIIMVQPTLKMHRGCFLSQICNFRCLQITPPSGNVMICIYGSIFKRIFCHLDNNYGQSWIKLANAKERLYICNNGLFSLYNTLWFGELDEKVDQERKEKKSDTHSHTLTHTNRHTHKIIEDQRLVS